MWIEVFIDSFGSFSTRDRSTTGVYISFSNILREHKHHREHVHTAMLISPNVKLSDALTPLRRDLKLLERGITVKKAENGRVMDVDVKGGVSLIITDHVEACVVCRHMGNNATMNSRECWCTKVDRTNFSTSILDHTMTRRRAQTNLVVKEMNKKFKDQTESFKRVERTKTGLYPVPCSFGGVDVDPHIQCVADVDHMMDLGLVKVMLTFITTNLTAKQHQIVDVRVKSFEFPRGWAKIEISAASKATHPITHMSKLLILSVYLFKGVVDDALYALLLDMIHLRGTLMQPFHNDSSIDEVTCCICGIADCI